MNEIKIEDVAKKANVSTEEALIKLKNAGIKVNSGSDIINDAGIKTLGIDPKKFKVDKRQELLKKVIDRRKRNSKSREVYVKNSGAETNAPRKRISREELLQKKLELEKSLKKVDEQRELIKSRPKQDKVEKSDKVKNDSKPVKKVTEVKAKPVSKPVVKPRPASNARQIVENAKRNAVAAEKAEQSKKAAALRQASKPAPKVAPKTTQKPSFTRKDEKTKQPVSKPVQSEFKRPAAPKTDAPVFSQVHRPKEKTDKEIADAKKAKAKKGPRQEKNINKALMDGMDQLAMEKAIESGELVDEFTKKEAAENAKIDSEKVKTAPSQVEKRRTTNTGYRGSNYRGNNFKGRHKKGKSRKDQAPKVIIRPEKIEIGDLVAVGDFAHAMGIKATEIVMKLMTQGVMASVTQSIDFETASVIAEEYGIKVELKMITEDDFLPDYKDMPAESESRPPIVTVMGHVDHGKTSLLDCIRKTSVASGEAGGITQHIGAYEVELEHGKITFLDTPGHEAFTTLRARGANVTDIVILVVAADDGVMPQTIEAIDHAKAAGVRLIIAVNKIDKDNANPEVIKTQLSEYGVISEEWGGEHQFQEISAKNNFQIDELLEKVLLEAEMLEAKGNPERSAEGIVIESRLDKQKGPVATILVSNGTLHKGDYFVVGTEFGKVRAMHNHIGRAVKEAGPSFPVELMGFSGIPESGEKFIVVENEKLAKQVAELRASKKREHEIMEKTAVTLSDLFDQIKDGEILDLNVILKADVQGSAEALKTSLLKLSNSEVNVKIIHDGAGGINESDVLLALASHAIVIGFNVRPDVNAKATAEREGVEINLYSVIYEAIDDVKSALEGMLSPEIKEEILGKVEIRQVFSVPKLGKIAGCYVLEGRVLRNSKIRVLRDNVVIYDGDIGSLKRFTEDAKEVKAGYECGMSIEKFNDIKEGDFFEVYQMVEEKRTLKDVE